MFADDNPLLNERYQITEQLGEGGMAVVYRARDLMLERSVAIKVLRKSFSADPDFRERFRQEAKAAANLSHPNIVTVHDFGLDEKHLFIVMEYLPGTDLKTMLKRRGRFNEDEALPLLIHTCAGIGYAHRAGLVHCDVKPHNIIVTPDRRVKVTDFGIARALASIHPEEKLAYVWGSPQYFSPEQAEGGAPSPASDVYSLGVVMYELLTGQLPFQSEDPAELARMHRETMPNVPSDRHSEISPMLQRIILKVLSKEPAARYRTADQLGRVLITYRRNRVGPEPEVVVPLPSEEPPAVPEPSFPAYPEQEETESSQGDYLDIDWIGILLGLLALVAVGGLIPLWLWVYFVYNPPLR
jgi:serine/threonine-protein kinase